MRKSISVTFFSVVATLLVLGTAVMGCSEWVLFNRYFAQERYEALDSVAEVTRRAADYVVQQAALPKGETFDKVLGLELGADDYMVKPFDAKEVVARIKAVLRRCQTSTAAAESTEGVIEFDNLRLDMNSYELRVKGKVVEAPPKELELLNCLASHPNRVYTRDQLLDEVCGFEYYGDSRTIDVHVKRLREKLAGASDKWELKTVWGVGYKFEVRQ